MRALFTPNAKVPSHLRWVPILLWAVLGLLGWQLLKPDVFPSPFEVLGAIPTLISDGVLQDVFASFVVNLEALGLAAIIGLPLCYMTRTPIVTPVGALLAKLRFAGSAPFYLPLLMVLSSGHSVKVGLLTLCNLFNLTTTMSGIVQGIEESRYDDCRTLRMGEWRSIWYVNIRGTISDAITTIKDCAGNGWAMLMFVEGVVRSEGGVGVVLLNSEKHVQYESFFAVVILVILVGIGQDLLLTQVRKAACPYAV